jgi:hypothetical protein
VPRGELWGGGGGPRTYVSIQIALPRGSDLERTDELARWFEEKLAAIPAVASFETSVTGERAVLLVYFPEELEDTGLPEAIKDQMYAFSLGFTGVDIRVYGFGPSFYGGGSSPPTYSIGVQGYNFERVRDIAANLGERLRSMTRVEEVDTNATGGFVRERATEWHDRPEWPSPRRNPGHILRLLTTRPIVASADEQKDNPRARSAKLRVAERLPHAC